MGKLTSHGLRGNVATEFFGKINLAQTNSGIVTRRIVENNAAQTPAQMARRIRWANMAAIYSTLREAARQGFTEALSGLSYWNQFIVANTSRVRLAITKDERKQGMAIVGPYQVTQGVLEEIQVNAYKTNIALGDLSLSAATTVAEFSQAVVENNANFDYEDKITFFQIQQIVLNGMPKVKFAFATIQLDKLSQELVPAGIGQSVDGYLGNPSLAGFIGGFCWIHSRLDKDGKLLASSQELICQNDQIIALYDTADRRLAVAESYGADFRNNVILRPTAADLIALEEFGLNHSNAESSSALISLAINSIECNGVMSLAGGAPIQIKSGDSLNIYGAGLVADGASVTLNKTDVNTGITVKDGIMTVAVPASFATETSLEALSVTVENEDGTKSTISTRFGSLTPTTSGSHR